MVGGEDIFAANRRWRVNSGSLGDGAKAFNDSIYKCLNGCGRSYKLLSSLQRHLSLECQKPKQFFCPLCDKSYTRKESLKFHMTEKHVPK